jgi:RNA polymerase sigma-70 factor, ECF subfamily
MKIDDLSSTPSLSQAKFLTRSSFIASLKKFSPLHWNNFVLAYTPTITFWIRRKNIPPKYEDDILQDTFRSVCIGIDRFDFDADRGSFRGWLRTITERRVADCLRKIPSEEEMPPQNLALLPSPAQKTDIEIAARQRAENEVKARTLELVRQSTTEKIWQKSLGFSSTDDEVVQKCRSGMVHVNKATQRLQSAQVLNCLGIDELQKWTNELEVFFKRRQQIYAQDP